ncbi:ABC transporter permease [Salinibacterium sp. NK8237]|uniref:ABC transporter permease n=1 Tax=Salinibacterium sp. NK8237 TaxID=2792038 RepID=UPI0018CDA838|nr:ABC transporter permease [Salinibacterium sp. NK8237]MBH0130097.1 ABC transporter permease [Salinibacterium sp. NK8237]
MTKRSNSPLDRPGVRIGVGLLAVAVLLLAWEIIGSSNAIPFLVPFSAAVSSAFSLVTGPELLEDVLPSAARAASGFAIGSALGVLVGIPLGRVKGLDPWFRPSLEFLRNTPLPALLPIAFVAFGATDETRIGLIAIGALWPVLLNAIDGARAVDGRLLDAARVVGVPQWRILIRVVLPAAAPQIFAGLRIALGIALVMMVVSELISSTSGLGYLVLQAQRSFALPQMYAGVLLLGVIGGIFTLIFAVIERRALRWYAGQKGLNDA